MTGICYLCSKVKDVTRLPSGSNACILCIWQYLSNNDEVEGAEIISSCEEECKDNSKEEKIDWRTVEKIEIKDEEGENTTDILFPNWSYP